jgi:catechol 2,3-dioxygenase-like lactoylglutathione lyase family enzyme
VSQPVAGRVMPMIVVGSVDAIRNFYVDTLGFTHVMGMVGKDGQLDFCRRHGRSSSERLCDLELHHANCRALLSCRDDGLRDGSRIGPSSLG